MGNLCAQSQYSNKIGISGNQNIAVISNGVSYNFASILDPADALQAGIIHSLAPLLLQTSYLEILETNNPILSLFQTITRIFLHIAEIDELKHYLENYDCCKILLHVANCTKNGILRALTFSVVAQIGNDKIIKYPFNIHDSSILFRLYYDVSTSKDKTAHGIDQSELLNGFLALGQLETKYYNGANN
ncbi:unnamed protein product [Rotaria socialis]|uniref:Uncharacterized protein n=1 Tax=Rotaria socialis TaxID=392032 RepID=A0A821NR02_9BILA|nr:unnamed protein product [Rotaria socialis]